MVFRWMCFNALIRWDQVEDHGTCHFNVVDDDRNVVSLTTTVNGKFGARSTGIVLNNEMDDFSVPTSAPGASPPAPNNFIQPFKRPLSSMSPTIVLKASIMSIFYHSKTLYLF